RKAIHNDDAKYGTLWEYEDLVHQIYLEWRQQIAAQNGELNHLLDRNSAERQALRKTVRRVLDHARYESAKERRLTELNDAPAPSKVEEEDWLDLRIDWNSNGALLSAQSRKMLELRREGKTFEEIGADMGLAKQRVSEMYNS